MEERYLIAGLGNPGDRYKNTRHNVGYQVAQLFAQKHRMDFCKQQKLLSQLAQGIYNEQKLYVTMPITYMNDSGKAIRLCVEFFHIDVKKVLIIVDDVAIPFGEYRLKSNSGSGGHNGLKDVEEHLRTDAYTRLRVGIGNPNPNRDLVGHVLGTFSSEEKKMLPQVIEKAVDIVELWLNEGLSHAMNFANVRTLSRKNEPTGDTKE